MIFVHKYEMFYYVSTIKINNNNNNDNNNNINNNQ